MPFASADTLPKGLNVVLARQRTGFWGRLGDGLARPDFTPADVPARIYTFEPWLGCLWGTSCRFCYVPNLSERFYPGGKNSRWFREWGQWLLPKPDITARLRRALLDDRGITRASVRGARIFMSAKTDPFLPVPDLMEVTKANLDAFARADIFLMCQTRSVAAANDPDVFDRLTAMARDGKVGVSFSIATDLMDEQRRIELGGAPPEPRLRAMARLKEAGVFVSAAVSPLMPYSPAFAARLQEVAHHASIQPLRDVGIGATSPQTVLGEVRAAVAGYEQLGHDLVAQLDAPHFSWGVGNKGFVGAFLAARRFYGPGRAPSQLALWSETRSSPPRRTREGQPGGEAVSTVTEPPAKPSE